VVRRVAPPAADRPVDVERVRRVDGFEAAGFATAGLAAAGLAGAALTATALAPTGLVAALFAAAVLGVLAAVAVEPDRDVVAARFGAVVSIG
jgi:hypothetical protein